LLDLYSRITEFIISGIYNISRRIFTARSRDELGNGCYIDIYYRDPYRHSRPYRLFIFRCVCGSKLM